MKILGISGFENSVMFKRGHWPGLEEREYRVTQGLDAAAALVVNGRIVAAVAEERVSRAKHTGAFPRGAIAACLAEGRLAIDDIDEVVHAFDYSPYRPLFDEDPIARARYNVVYSRETLVQQAQQAFPRLAPQRLTHVDHHLAHGASAYFTSGWDECLVVVVDGMGEMHSASVFHARDGRLRRLGRILAHDSIGILYGLVTLHLGFDFNADEYKIMGLAPYGDPSRFRRFFDDAVRTASDGGLKIPLLRLNRTRDECERYLVTRARLAECLTPPRAPESEITDTHRDVAAALQECLDRAMLHICTTWARKTGLRRLALAGGVALNCTANGRLLQSGAFDEIYVQPAAGDDGSALGAALWRAAEAGEVHNRRMPVPFLGPAPTASRISRALSGRDDVSAKPLGSLESACAEAARLIAQGRVVAWYRGRMEFGPRALGNRSILADPGDPSMRDRVNAMVKLREGFRPFAPAVTLEEAHHWFEVAPGTRMPYMIMTVDVRPAFRRELPAVTHINGSARLQTVAADDNPEFHALLRAVGRTTGREMVLNTSFNVRGQPIVNTPEEAIETFLGTGIDALFLEDTLVTRARAAAPRAPFYRPSAAAYTPA